MTELNLAYSLNNEEDDEMNYPPPPPPKQTSPQPPSPQQLQQIQQPPQQIPQQVYKLNFQQQPQQSQQSQQIQRYPEYSFWDRMVLSRREVLKLLILSIVIVIGISLEKIGYHYISNYISSNDLTSLQEFLVRLSFPLFVILLLWIIKSF
jgi:hypothetical protein